MIRAFRSEITKMRRWSVASAALFMAGFTCLGILLALRREMRPHAPFALRLVLISPQGLETLEIGAASVIAAIAVITVGASVASEWSQGTLRSILVREAGRTRLLAGKFLATLAYLLLATILTLVLGAIAGIAGAAGYHLDTSLWFSSTGVVDWLEFAGNVLIALTGWCLLALLFAVVTRSVAGAIGAALTYGLAVEGLVAGVLPEIGRWLPGHIFAAVVAGGTSAVPYSTALLCCIAYAAGFALVSFGLFQRMDVTA